MAHPQLVTPLDKVAALTPFEGRPVISVGLESPGAAGGLRDALTVDPVEFSHDQLVAVILIGPVAKIRFEEVKDTDGLRRVHVMQVDEAAIIDPAAVEGLLADQREKVQAAIIEAERQQGIHRLPTGDGDGDEDDPEVVAGRIHNSGGHTDGLRDDCPLCRLEAEVAAEENGTTVEEEFEKRRAAQ